MPNLNIFIPTAEYGVDSKAPEVIHTTRCWDTVPRMRDALLFGEVQVTVIEVVHDFDNGKVTITTSPLPADGIVELLNDTDKMWKKG